MKKPEKKTQKELESFRGNDIDRSVMHGYLNGYNMGLADMDAYRKWELEQKADVGKIEKILDKRIFCEEFAYLNELLVLQKSTDMEHKVQIEKLSIKKLLLIQDISKMILEEEK